MVSNLITKIKGFFKRGEGRGQGKHKGRPLGGEINHTRPWVGGLKASLKTKFIS
jgi:hypothetical protein